MPITIEVIAQACHEANRSLCLGLDDESQLHWNIAEKWQRDSAIKGVEFRLAHPGGSPGAQHEAWLKDKIADGWKYGEKKDSASKTHPCLVPYDKLPAEQQAKDRLFCAIVDALSPLLTNNNLNENLRIQ